MPTYTGYQFGGFYTQKAGAGTQIIDENGDITGSSGSFVTPSTSVTLYAKWEVACGSNEEYVNGSCKCQSGYYRSGSNGTCKTTCDSGYLAIVGEEMCYEFNGNSDFYSDMYCAVDPIDNGPGGCPSFGSTNWGEGSCSDLDVLGNSACSSLNVGDLSYDNPGESSGNVCWCKVEKSKSHMDLEDPAATTHTFWVKQLNTTNYCSSAATCAQYCLDLYRIEGTGTMTNCGNTISWAPNRARLLLYIGG